MRRIYSATIVAATLLVMLITVSSALSVDLQTQQSASQMSSPPTSRVTPMPVGGRKPRPSDNVKPVLAYPNYQPLACTAPVINVSRRVGQEAESFVVINPTNSNNLVAFSNMSGSSSIFRAYSTDGGSTWATGTVATNAACCDGQAAFDSFGNLFLVFVNLVHIHKR